MQKTGSNNMLKLFKTIRYLSVFVTLLIVAFTFLKSPAAIAFAIETAGTEFGIVTDPPQSFISGLNMAPGDKISAPLKVKNIGKHDFLYDVSAVNQSVDNSAYKLFDILELEIKDSAGNLLYQGLIKDLQNQVLGVLGPQGTSNSSSLLNYTVTFPTQYGNEFQGKTTNVTFLFAAKEHPCDLPDGRVLWDSPLEKPDVNTRHGRMMPISFHLVDSNNVMDEVKRGIDLYITGKNDVGVPVEYVFTIEDGTLGWNEKLEKPHYTLLLDTEKYPVKHDTYYTATAKYGSQILGETKFISGH